MNNSEIAKNNMYKKVKTFLNNHYALFTGYTRLLTQIMQYQNLNNKLDGYIKDQGKVISGMATGKEQARAALSAITVRASRKLLVYAKDKNDAVLTALFDVRDYDFTHPTYSDGLARIENVLDTMKAIKDPLTDYRVSAADITAIETGLAACKAQQGAPGDAHSSREAATKGIKITMDAIDDCLGILDDLIENEYEDSNPAEVEQYHKDRRTDNTAVRHSGINAIVSSSGAFAEGVTVTVVELSKTAVSDMNGIAGISPMQSGTYHVSFAGAGYVSQTLTLTIAQGKILQVSVEMVKG